MVAHWWHGSPVMLVAGVSVSSGRASPIHSMLLTYRTTPATCSVKLLVIPFIVFSCAYMCCVLVGGLKAIPQTMVLASVVTMELLKALGMLY